MLMMEHYRLSVMLRWSDLESLKVKDIPLKIHLQSLRKRREWPTCAVYDCSSCKDGCECTEKGSENFLRGRPRKTIPCECADDDVEIIVVRKKKERWTRTGSTPMFFDDFKAEAERSDSGLLFGPDGRAFCYDFEEITDDLQPSVSSEQKGKPSLHSEGGESVVLDDSFVRSFYVSPRQSRGKKRAERNNARIEARLGPLRESLSGLKSRLKYLDGKRRDMALARISTLRKGIKTLQDELLELSSPTREEVGGTQVPPPPTFTGSGTTQSPLVRVLVSDGGVYYGCSSCEFPLSLPTGACTNSGCRLLGKPCKATFRQKRNGRVIVVTDWFTSRGRYGK